jgi:hypothetical protein
MPIRLLRAIAIEWTETGRRPTRVAWEPVNALDWIVQPDGTVTVPAPRA